MQTAESLPYIVVPVGLMAASLVLALLIAISRPSSTKKIMLLWFAMPFALLALYAFAVLLFGPPVEKPADAAIFIVMLGFGIGAIPWGLSCLLGLVVGRTLSLFTGANGRSSLEPVQAQQAKPPSQSAVVEQGWRAVHVGFPNDGLEFDGIDVWHSKWSEEEGTSITLPHPAHPGQRHVYGIFSIRQGPRFVRFAAEELSNSAWGFYRETAHTHNVGQPGQ